MHSFRGENFNDIVDSFAAAELTVDDEHFWMLGQRSDEETRWVAFRRQIKLSTLLNISAKHPYMRCRRSTEKKIDAVENQADGVLVEELLKRQWISFEMELRPYRCHSLRCCRQRSSSSYQSRGHSHQFGSFL